MNYCTQFKSAAENIIDRIEEICPRFKHHAIMLPVQIGNVGIMAVDSLLQIRILSESSLAEAGPLPVTAGTAIGVGVALGAQWVSANLVAEHYKRPVDYNRATIAVAALGACIPAALKFL